MKPKKCRSCGNKFTPIRPLQSVCSLECAIIKGKAASTAQKRAEAASKRAEHRKAKESIKTRGDYARDAQIIYNAYIRKRDEGKPCISCGSYTGKQNAGHYRSVGSAPELRFNELNCHLQCEKCNTYLSGNLINYRIELIKRIGLEAVDWLEGKHEPPHYSIECLKSIKAEYRRKTKERSAPKTYALMKSAGC